MSFDPEKVKRFAVSRDGIQDPDDEGPYVLHSDYAQLLAGYNEAITQIRTLIRERDGLLADVLALRRHPRLANPFEPLCQDEEVSVEAIRKLYPIPNPAPEFPLPKK